MKKIIKKAVFLLAMAITVAGCDSSVSELLSDELISSNLSKDGKTDPELLIGEWDAIKFAYTADGNSISSVSKISNCAVNIRNSFSLTDDEWPGYDISVVFKFCSYPYAISSEYLNYIVEKSACYAILIQYTDDEIEVDYALKNAYSFAIKDNELTIYFTGVKNNNLLILKKR